MFLGVYQRCVCRSLGVLEYLRTNGKKNGAILPGETNFYVNVNTYGYGLYEAIVTCGSCTNSIVLNNPNPVSCNVSVNVTNSGGTYTANVSGCSTAISYSWE